MQFPDLEPLYREALATPLLSARDALEVVLDSMLERGAYKHTPTVNAHARMRAVAFQFAARELGLRPLGYNRPGTERQPRAFQHLWVCFERIGALDLVSSTSWTAQIPTSSSRTRPTDSRTPTPP